MDALAALLRRSLERVERTASLCVPLVCYLYIVHFGLAGQRV